MLAEDGQHAAVHGLFQARASFTAAAAELPHADTLVIESTYGHPDYRLPPRDQCIAEFLALVPGAGRGNGARRPRIRARQEPGGDPHLTDAGIPVLQHRSIYEVSRMYEQLGCPLGQFPRFRGRAEPGWAVLRRPARR